MKLLGVAQVKLLTHTHAYIISYAHTCKHNTYVPRERTIEGEKNREKGERESVRGRERVKGECSRTDTLLTREFHFHVRESTHACTILYM